MHFLITNEVREIFNHKLYSQRFKQITDLVSTKLNIDKKRFFECHFVDEKTIRGVNKNYRNKDYITDVISFAFDDGEIITPLLGEMYICYQKVVDQASQFAHSFERELCFLFTHGLLHLLGYDHIKIEDEKIMFALQDEILNELKITRNINGAKND